MGSKSSKPKSQKNASDDDKQIIVKTQNLPQEEIMQVAKKIDACNVTKDASTIKANVIESTSLTTQIFASFKRNGSIKNIFMKIWFTPTEEMLKEDNSLYVEACVYACAVPIMLQSSPFFVDFVGFQTCHGFIEENRMLMNNDQSFIKATTMNSALMELVSRTKLVKPELLKSQLFLNDPFPPLDFLLTEQVPNSETLQHWFLPGNIAQGIEGKVFKRDLIQTKSIIFQVLWTLNVLKGAKLRHNDLHLNNILVQYLPNSETCYFTIPGHNGAKDQHFKVIMNYKLYFFDWDTAGSDYIFNRDLYYSLYCGRGFGCSEFESNPGYDVYKFGSGIENVMNATKDDQIRADFSTEAKKFLSTIVNILNTNPETRLKIRPPPSEQLEWRENLPQPQTKSGYKAITYGNAPVIPNPNPDQANKKPWVEVPLHFDLEEIISDLFPEFLIPSSALPSGQKIYRPLTPDQLKTIIQNVESDSRFASIVENPI